MIRKLAAEFIGTAWLVLGAAGLRFWPQPFLAWASASLGSPWRSA